MHPLKADVRICTPSVMSYSHQNASHSATSFVCHFLSSKFRISRGGPAISGTWHPLSLPAEGQGNKCLNAEVIWRPNDVWILHQWAKMASDHWHLKLLISSRIHLLKDLIRIFTQFLFVFPSPFHESRLHAHVHAYTCTCKCIGSAFTYRNQ